MLRWPCLLALVFAATGVAFAAAAEKFSDKSLGIEVTAPEGFMKAPDTPAKDDFIGQPKALFFAPNVTETGGILLIHHMDLPGGVDYDTFKKAFVEQLGMAFGDSFKLLKQTDLTVEKLSGMVLEFECPGDGGKPAPGGTIPHHVRWVFIREGEKKLVGMIYAARQAAWKDLDGKFTASEKSLKAAG